MILRPEYRYLRDREAYEVFHLIDMLRDFSMYDYNHVLTRMWHVAEVEEYTPYIQTEKLERIYGWDTQMNSNGILIDGTLFMETVGTLHEIESGIFMRVIDANMPIQLPPPPHIFLWHGQETFHSPNVDIEIRIDALCYEIITENQSIIDCITEKYTLC